MHHKQQGKQLPLCLESYFCLVHKYNKRGTILRMDITICLPAGLKTFRNCSVYQ